MKIQDRKENKSTPPKLGIWGWLFINLLIVSTAIVYAIGAFVFLSDFLSQEPYFNLSLRLFIISMAMVFLVILTLILEFKNKSGFPRWAVITLWSRILASLYISLAIGFQIGFNGQIILNHILDVSIIVIATLYLRNSKRVRNKFVK